MCLLSVRFDQVAALVKSLMKVHRLTARGWGFAVDNSVSRAGCCHYDTKTISLSRHLVANPRHAINDVKNILLHEIAHALVGPAVGHGSVWRAMAIQIGCDGCRCHAMELKPQGYVLACVLCGCMNGLRHRACRSTWHGKTCAVCARVGSLIILPRKTWEDYAVSDESPHDPDITILN